jgi:eukaryotic-like serine/threonine-protein kinase
MTAQWFGDYEIVKRLRVGGMATLYLARRHGAAGFSRLVALKMIHPHLVEQPAFVEMFVDEARICSQISHPNVVHVEEFGVIDGVHYLVMEFLDGCSVAELLQLFQRRRCRLDPELAARVIMQIAGGLHAAHETRDADGDPLDIVHRDISPSNLLLSVDGNAKLIDFGIARARNRLSETQAGVTLKGKYNYVAPEQARHGAVDRRCDVFSLGVVFWEMLVGRPLFPDDSYLTLFNRLQRTEVEPPSAANPEVPAVLDPIVLAMLHHDPAERLQTAAEVERRIAAATPGAANREASELGGLAREVRDAYAAQRVAEGGPDSPVGFSPTPRSIRLPTTRTRAEPEAEPAPDAHGAATTQPASPPRWTRRPIGFAAAGLVAGLAVVAVIGARSGRTASRGAAGQPRPRELELSEVPAPGDPPASPVAPPRSAAPAAATSAPPPAAAPATASPASPPATAVPAAAASATTAPATAPSPTAASATARPASAAAIAPSRPAASAALRPAPAPAHVAAPPASSARDADRAFARPRPRRTPAPAPAGDPVAARPPPRPSPEHPAVVTPPFAGKSFDDADNERPAADPGAVKVKKTPIVPTFDN